MSKTQVQKAIEKHLKSSGLEMSKKLSSGSCGFLSSTPPTYDVRKVYSLEDLYKLNKEGFRVDTSLGTFLFNAFMKD